MTPEGMTPEGAREVLGEHTDHVAVGPARTCVRVEPEPGDEHCLPYLLAAAYVAACAELDKTRRVLSIRTKYYEGSLHVAEAIQNQAQADLATAQGRIEAVLAVLDDPTPHSAAAIKAWVRIVLNGGGINVFTKAPKCSCPACIALTGDPQ